MLFIKSFLLMNSAAFAAVLRTMYCIHIADAIQRWRLKVWWHYATIFVYLICLVHTFHHVHHFCPCRFLSPASSVRKESRNRKNFPGMPMGEVNSRLLYIHQAEAPSTELHCTLTELRCTLIELGRTLTDIRRTPWLSYAAFHYMVGEMWGGGLAN